ncbi:MAG TPA: TonB-dependent receptor, partial [Ignavibacteriaceae bacterium]|nr:TonB-dependent receptor [Ignavibacteriaceae bacterium]
MLPSGIRLIFLHLLINISVLAQSGNITGKIVDSETGENIIGANVLIEGTDYGAASDIDGRYIIKNVPAGNYNLKVSFVSYAATIVKDINVEEGKTSEVNLSLVPSAISIDEVVVTSAADNSYEAALLNQQRKSITISDGVSLEQIKRSTDATTAEALKRVSGVTLSEGKYILVRGTSERYSAALLNNLPLSSTEPDKKTFAFDLIPSNLIDNSIIIKSFTPDNPGEFAGGLIKVNTVDFPSRTTFNFSYS